MPTASPLDLNTNFMKKFRNIIIVSYCLTCFFGCGSSSSTNELNEVINVPYTNEKPESFVADRFFSEIKFVPLETNDKCLLSGAQQVELRDSLIFVCDNYNLFVFNDNGKFISQIGRRGRGPGEYIGGFRGFFVDMDKRTVNIILPVDRSVMVYAFDGTYLSSEEIPPELYDWGYYAMPVEDNKVFIFNSHNPGNNMAYTLMNRSDPEQATYFCTYDPVRLEDYTYHFATHPITRFENKIHFTMPLDPQIYEYVDGEVAAKYHIETPSEIIPEDVMQKEEGSYLSKLVKLTSNRYFGGFTDIFETDGFVFLHYMAGQAYPGLYVLDKNNNTGSYHVFPPTNEKVTSPVFPFSASDGNRIASVVPIREVLKLKDYLADYEIGDDNSYADLPNSLNNMDENSNPLLVFYTVSSSETTFSSGAKE